MNRREFKNNYRKHSNTETFYNFGHVFRLILAICMISGILSALSGCQLAREDAFANEEEMGELQSEFIDDPDRLIGVLVTTEDISRLDAVMKKETVTNEETGETQEHINYVFDVEKGYAIFCTNMTEEGDTVNYTASFTDPAFSSGKHSFHYKQNEDLESQEEIITVEAALSVFPNEEGILYHMNPIYQSKDGSIYAIARDAVMIQPAQEGPYQSWTFHEETTTTENNTKKIIDTTVTVSIDIIFSPIQIVVLQMDTDNAVLSRTEYAPGTLPDTFTTNPETEYLIVETHKQDLEGNILTSRILYDQKDSLLETFYYRETDHLCIRQLTSIHWTNP